MAGPEIPLHMMLSITNMIIDVWGRNVQFTRQIRPNSYRYMIDAIWLSDQLLDIDGSASDSDRLPNKLLDIYQLHSDSDIYIYIYDAIGGPEIGIDGGFPPHIEDCSSFAILPLEIFICSPDRSRYHYVRCHSPPSTPDPKWEPLHFGTWSDSSLRNPIDLLLIQIRFRKKLFNYYPITSFFEYRIH